MFFMKLLMVHSAVLLYLCTVEGYSVGNGYSQTISRKSRSIMVDVFDEEPVELLEEMPLVRVKREDALTEKTEDTKSEVTDKPDQAGFGLADKEESKMTSESTTEIFEDKDTTDVSPDPIKSTTTFIPEVTSFVNSNIKSSSETSKNMTINDAASIASTTKPILDATTKMPEPQNSTLAPNLSTKSPNIVAKSTPAPMNNLDSKKSGEPNIHVSRYISILITLLLAKTLM